MQMWNNVSISEWKLQTHSFLKHLWRTHNVPDSVEEASTDPIFTVRFNSSPLKIYSFSHKESNITALSLAVLKG